MNLFLRECKSNLKSLLIWCGCSVLLIFGVLAKYSGLSENDQNINQLMAQMPKAMQIIMGGGAFDFTTIGGFYGVTFGYLQLIAAIYAMLLGANVVAREERDKTVEFLLTKPVPRTKIIGRKLLTVLFYLILFTVVIYITSIFGVGLFDSGAKLNGSIALLCTGLLLIQLIYASLGVLLASVGKQPRRPARIGMAVVFGTYFLALAIQFEDSLSVLRPFTPIGYFDTAAVLNSKGLSVGYSLLSLTLTLVLCTAALYFYKKRDMKI